MDTFDPTDEEPLWGLSLTEPAAPADHVDELLSTLLDISDDVCQAVAWLAENWSLDLPRLNWSAGDGYGGNALRLIAACRDRAELDRAAAILGTPLAPLAKYGDRQWLHVRRQFGLVLLDVVYSEPADDTITRYVARYWVEPTEDPVARYVARYLDKATDNGPQAGAA